MTLTQAWMLIIILVMAAFMVVSTVWGKNSDQKDEDQN
ncbi:Uncharacterised protein [uncultured Roseburia sp.]|nr:Uncharacterised protein [uncultured Roseburia sp.]